MKYMMLVCVDATRFAEDEAAGCARNRGVADSGDSGSFPWLDDVIARGIRLHGDRLRPADEAKTVQVRDGEILVSDGPFAETKEIICGYDMLECGSLRRPSRWPRRIRSPGLRQDRGQGGVVYVTPAAACTARRSAWTAVWSRLACTALVSRTSHRPAAGSRARLVPVKPVCDTAVGGQWPPRMSKPSPGQAQP